MADLLEQLKTTLTGRYTILRELGAGGMATVYLAEDPKHRRQVALKVLRPDLAASLGPERFLREVTIAANLQHPHILPVYDSGEAGGFLYYVMPYVAGESLRDRLARHGELPVSDAVRILRDVADALAAAHAKGVVHRDIKPENVMLSGRHALVADFGVAKAVSEATGRQQLTTAGVALGTPTYMAPEQAVADPLTDHRADLYAFGVTAYEVLTGQPPFVGATPQAVLAAHVTETPVPVTQRRATIPAPLAQLVMRCLEKKPADRPQTADELLPALEGLTTPSGGTTPTTVPPRALAPRSPQRRLAAAVIVVAAIGVALWRLTAGEPAVPVDPGVVAVLPFRVAGADPALHYLREGMIDLLAANLTGEGGPRATDPRTVTAAFRRAAGGEDGELSQMQAVAMAQGIGAGQVLLGGIVGSAAHITLSATVVNVPGGSTRAQGSVEGPLDSLPALVDQLTAQLLVRGAGVGGQGEASLTTRSLAALQAYLSGQRNYRHGQYDSAAAHYTRALGLDSSFTLAAWGAMLAEGWGASVPDFTRIRELAWEGRERLSERDRAMLVAYVGPRFPQRPLQSELLAAWERVVARYGDLADAWYFLGDKYVHDGRYLGYPDWMERAKAAFERALALDSSFAGPISHLINLAAWHHDTASARRLGPLYTEVAARGARFDHVVRWDLARALGDPEPMREFWAGFTPGANLPPYVAYYALATGGDPAVADSMLDIVARGASADRARIEYHATRAVYSLNVGRPAAARLQLDSAVRAGVPDAQRTVGVVLGATYWDADSVAGAEAAGRLAALTAGPIPESRPARAPYLDNLCVLGQWHLAVGAAAELRQIIPRLRDPTPSDNPAATISTPALCATILEAAAATIEQRADARALVERADSIMRLGPYGIQFVPFENLVLYGNQFVPFENLVLGRLFAELGDPARGLAAVRRGGPLGEDVFMTAYLREEGRLAALAGDREGAIRAWNRYLEIRANPEPAVQPVVDDVRAALASLVGEQPGR